MYTGSTVPFVNPTQRALHFLGHGHEFGAADEFEYERMADAFMSDPLQGDLLECTNPTGDHDRIRLHAITLHFGVAYNVTIVRTYHIRNALGVARKGGPLGFITAKCAEVH